MWVKKFPDKVKIKPETETYMVVKLRILTSIFLVKIVRVKKFPHKVKIKTGNGNLPGSEISNIDIVITSCLHLTPK